jgi:peptidoglycan/xylan/chitin deacetylase (PgdA/CDA1 family)
MPVDTLAITFDDGPHPEGTPAVLDALQALGWPATFFVLGSEARRHPELVRELIARGHTVGVHGYEHRYLIARTPWGAANDLRRAIGVVEDVTGTRPVWWRPPYGVLSGPSLLAARAQRVRPLLWSAWGKDWTDTATGASVVAEAARGRLVGGTLLLHDSDITSAPGSWKATVAALPLLAEHLHAAGIRVAPLPD